MSQNWLRDRPHVDAFINFARTRHGCVVLLGASIGLLYLPAWSDSLLRRALAGGSSWLLITAMLLYAGLDLRRQRSRLASAIATDADRTLGYALIGSGVVIYPLCRFALWSQALVWLSVLLGIAISTWGFTFFRYCRLATLLIGLTVYPKLGILSRTVWDFFVPPNALENWMAQGATTVLKSLGWQVVADGRFMVFPEGQVEVGWGCNGLDMAITVAVMGWFLGLLFRQSTRRLLMLMGLGSAIALLANIPRLMLVAIAYVYWGEDWFAFWHGFWGGQIFSGILFTFYYYLTMSLLEPTEKTL